MGLVHSMSEPLGACFHVGHGLSNAMLLPAVTEGWYGMGPISVLPEYQKQGIGKSLVEEGLSALKEVGGQGCALVGEPDYYKRFGFKNVAELVHEGIRQEVFVVLPLAEKVPQGMVVFHKGFLANG